MKRRTVMRGLAALLAAGASGCERRAGVEASAADRGDGGTPEPRHLRRHIDDAPRTLDPSLNTDIPTLRILDDLFEGLVRLDAAGAIQPAVAQRWTENDEGRRWTFELREDARWSNGDPVTAHDFVYAWRRLVDPATRSQSVQQVTPIVNALAIAQGEARADSLGVAALSDHRLEVKLAQRTPWFLYLLTNNYLMPLHRATIERHGEGWTRPGNLVGNGPFVLVSHRINDSLRLERNAHHPEAASIGLDAVTYYPVTDRSAVTSRYLAGDLDYTDGFQIDDIDWLRQRLAPGELRLAPYFGTVMLGMHPTRPPFDSPALRQAMNLAIDREIVTEKLLHGVYLPAYNVVPPLPGYTPAIPEWASWTAERRHERARELYAQAGYSKRRPLRVELAYPGGDPQSRRTLEALSAMWRTVLGADVQLASEEFRVLIQNRVLGKHRLFWYAWIGDYPDPLTFLEMRRATGGQNFGGYDNPRFETLLDRAAVAASEGERNALYAQAEALLNEDAVNLPVYFYQSRHLVKPYVKGFVGNAMDRTASRELWLEPRGREGA